MKNILGTEKDLELFNKEGKRVYWFRKDSDGYSWERTYDSNGNELTYKNSNGYSWETTYDSNDYVLTYKDSDGYSSEYTYDSNGKELTFKDSDGIKRGFDIPEYTMEELVEKLGNFKIKKKRNWEQE
jgi:YD repeat-containing protein